MYSVVGSLCLLPKLTSHRNTFACTVGVDMARYRDLCFQKAIHLFNAHSYTPPTVGLLYFCIKFYRN